MVILPAITLLSCLYHSWTFFIKILPCSLSVFKHSCCVSFALQFPLLLSFGHLSRDMRQTVMEFFYRQSTAGWCMAPISPWLEPPERLNHRWVRQWCKKALWPTRERERETMRERRKEERKSIWGGNRCKEKKGKKGMKGVFIGNRKRKTVSVPHTLTSSLGHKGRYTQEQVQSIFSHQSVTDKCCLLLAPLSQWHIELIPLTVPCTLFSSSSFAITSLSPRPRCSRH